MTGDTYPDRVGTHFVTKFKKALNRVGAREVGLVGYFVLSYIAETEHAIWYERAPLFWISEIADRSGKNRNAVAQAIKRCRELGWLHWSQKNDRTQAVAWVLIPDQYLRDSEPASGEEPFVKRNVAQDNNDVQRNVARMVAQTPKDVQRNVARNIALSYLPTNAPPPPEESGWEEAAREVRKEQVHQDQAALAECQKNELRPSDVLDLIAYFRSVKDTFRNPPGALYQALRSARLENRGNWWNAFPNASQLVERHAIDARSRREAKKMLDDREHERLQREKRESDRQMLINWEREFGPKLDAMPENEIDELLILCPKGTQECFNQLGRRRDNTLIRPTLLEVLAKRQAA